MALRRNSLIAGISIAVACLSSPVMADDSVISSRHVDSPYLYDNYIYDYMNHRDTITIGAGDASRSNIIIQHPTPWPSYINNTTINITSQQGISAFEQLLSGANSTASTSSGATSGAAAAASTQTGMSTGN